MEIPLNVKSTASNRLFDNEIHVTTGDGTGGSIEVFADGE